MTLNFSLNARIKKIGAELGFAGVGITDIKGHEQADYFANWVQKRSHGDMTYLERNQDLRFNPILMMPEVKSIIVCRLNYPAIKKNCNCRDSNFQDTRVDDDEKENFVEIATYAQGRDYHKIVYKKLDLFAKKISEFIDKPIRYRVFCDSAPVLEKALAAKAGLGWIGKNSLLINEKDGSYFFLGEIFTDLDLTFDEPVLSRCGNCRRCLDACPTRALSVPYQLDASRCIAYLTIEHNGEIADELKKCIGNKIFGCDACQVVCPWNKRINDDQTVIKDFVKRFANLNLKELLRWTEEEYLERTAGTVLRRLGYKRWRRNLLLQSK